MAMPKISEVFILKLGGSVITDKKSGRPSLRRSLIEHIAKELSLAFKKKLLSRIILLHGAGSIGHPLAHRYRLVNQPFTASRLIGMGKTINAMRSLTTSLADILLKAGLPVIPFQTSTFVKKQGERLVFTDTSIIKIILKHHGIPLLGGDIVINNNKTHIGSADILAVQLAKHFPKAKLLFATDIGGVYKKFPPLAPSKPLVRITRTQLQKLILEDKTTITPYDVTGAMIGKLKALLALRKRTAVIFNGLNPQVFSDILRGKIRGTTIQL